MIAENRSSVISSTLNATHLPCSFSPSPSSTSIADLSNHPSSSAWVNENFVVGDVLGSGGRGGRFPSETPRRVLDLICVRGFYFDKLKRECDAGKRRLKSKEILDLFVIAKSK